MDSLWFTQTNSNININYKCEAGANNASTLDQPAIYVKMRAVAAEQNPHLGASALRT
jgi:hypothetical protein